MEGNFKYCLLFIHAVNSVRIYVAQGTLSERLCIPQSTPFQFYNFESGFMIKK
jgi:hypothetical protein